MEFDRTLLTENHLIKVITCIEKHGYEVDDFEFSTQRLHGYRKGMFDPKAVVYACRVSTRIEKSYVLGDEPDFSVSFCDDLLSGVYNKQ